MNRQVYVEEKQDKSLSSWALEVLGLEFEPAHKLEWQYSPLPFFF